MEILIKKWNENGFIKDSLKGIFILASVLSVLSAFAFADGRTNEPSHQTLFSNVITSYNDANAVTIADSQGLVVTTGNVGIGTASPGARLEVETTSSEAGIHIDANSVGGTPLIRLQQQGASKWGWIGEYPAAGKSCLFDYAVGVNSCVMTMSGGKVGIGTTSPLRVLHVKGAVGTAQIESTGTSGTLYFGDTASSVIDNQGIGSRGNSIAIMTGGGDKVTVLSTGNVGIGTTGPAAQLHIVRASDVSTSPQLSVETVSGDINNPRVLFKTTGDGRVLRVQSATARTDMAILDVVNSVGTVFSIRGDGNVGIGTTSPQSKLHVDQGNIVIGAASGGSQDLRFREASTDLIGLRYQGSASGNPLDIYNFQSGWTLGRITETGNVWLGGTTAASSPTIAIQAAGNVGIGTAGPGAKLEVKQTDNTVFDAATIASTGPRIEINNPSTTSGSYAELTFHVNGAGDARARIVGLNTGTVDQSHLAFVTETGNVMAERMRITNSGNVGIGTTDPGSYRLLVAGTAGKPGGGSWSDSSDIRLKNNVRKIEDALNRISQLNGIIYEWKEPEKHGNMTGIYMGMVANDVEKVFPEWVGTDDKGYKTLGFIGFEALATEAIKELAEKNEDLSKENFEVKQRLNQLEEKVASLEK